EFKAADADGNGAIDKSEVSKVFAAIGEQATDEQVEKMVAEIDLDSDGRVSFPEFLKMIVNHRGTLGAAIKKNAELQEIKGAIGKHSYAVEEKDAYVEHINNTLKDDKYLTSNGYLPIPHDDTSLFNAVSDGILLSQLINKAKKDTIDERAVNTPKKGKKLNPWETNENINLVINSAKVNIHAYDITKCVEAQKEYLVLGMVWQIIKIQLLSTINIKETPELVVLLKDEEELKDLLALPPEDILLRWFNYHLEKAGTD
ncbi:fimA, partial [Symbiodinium sp. KB8]